MKAQTRWNMRGKNFPPFFLSIHLIFHPKHSNQDSQHFILPLELQIKHRHTDKQTPMFVYSRTNALRYAHTCTAATRTNNNHIYEDAWLRVHTQTHMQTLQLWLKWSNFSWWTAWGLVAATRSLKENQSGQRKGRGKESFRGVAVFTWNLSHGSNTATFNQIGSQLQRIKQLIITLW